MAITLETALRVYLIADPAFAECDLIEKSREALAGGVTMIQLRAKSLTDREAFALGVALRDECTHQGMPLSAGEVLPDGTIEWPWHGARFDCVTGALRRGPAEEDVRAYVVRLDGDDLLVES